MMKPDLLYLGALLVDTVIGDPRCNLHPVVMIGNLINFFEKLLLKENDTANNKKKAGALLCLFTVGIVFTVSYSIVLLLEFVGHYSLFFGNILLLSFTISPHALRKAAKEIQVLLSIGDILEARRKVSWIVGRDTHNLNEAEITRATVETVAENITDGIVAPLFYAFIGGVPLACAYRAVNTLDSMVGYKSECYLNFGMISAKVDDICSFIPARITAMLLIFTTLLLPGYSGERAWKILWRDAAKHPSPNSGYAEAPVAGALGIRLGGNNFYFGQPSFREYMGDDDNILNREHIGKTVILMYAVTLAFVLIVTFI